MAESTGNSPSGKPVSPALYALLGLMALRSWTGYELTEQAHRSLRFLWPTSEAHLYREQKRLVALGWAKATAEATGKRQRKRYSITARGRRALREWLDTEPAPPGFEIEGLVRTFFGDLGSIEALTESMTVSAAQARERLDELLGFVDEYLDTGGPFPDRLHVVALAVEVLIDQLAALENFFTSAAAEVTEWQSPTREGIDAATRSRLERIRATHRR